VNVSAIYLHVLLYSVGPL